MQQRKTALVWFTNNLRTKDNVLLFKATQEYEKVIAIYTLNPTLFKKDIYGFKRTEKFRAKFLLETLHNLKENLKKLNISFLVFFEHAPHVISKQLKKYNAETLFYQEEFTDEEVKTFEAVKKTIPKETKIISLIDQFLYHPEDVPYETENIPKVFSQFIKKVEKYSFVRKENSTKKMPNTNLVDNDTIIPTLETLGFIDFKKHQHSAFPFNGGENEALQRLDNYFFKTNNLSIYKITRNGLLGLDYSSKFSPWLANGSISAKTIFWKIKEYEKKVVKNDSTYWLIFELIWRDYFKYIAIKHKNNLFKLNGILEKEYLWRTKTALVVNWINGETDEPFVNANMNELKNTGWMSNRGRQNVASYFAKELKIDWRIGAAYFESMLIDNDVHSNYGNWQYIAGVGNDPRDRKFNIEFQAERYDPNAIYQDLWLQNASL